MKLPLLLTLTLLTSGKVHALEIARLFQQPSAAQWLAYEAALSLKKIDQNISPANTPDENNSGLIQAAPGAIIAARTRKDPNYYYHWVRDAALVVEGYLAEFPYIEPGKAHAMLHKINDYVEFSEHLQNLRPEGLATTGMGEPKFEVNGTHFLEPWGRPQNDGPALRAISLMRFARLVGPGSSIQPRLRNVIRRDLDYVAQHWPEPSVDLWEEVRGDHFYTRMVQLRALREGADFVRGEGFFILANDYDTQADLLKKTLSQFWDNERGHLIPTVRRVDGLDYKTSQVDSAVLLGLLHGNCMRKPVRFSDPKVLSTIQRLFTAFKEIYPINKTPGTHGVAVGRYPEDLYGGSHFRAGNPWPMTTLAVAEAAYRASLEFRQKGQLELAEKWLKIGDDQVLRVQTHAHLDGSLNEQIDRHSGEMTSVSDLTWNYAALLTTARARAQAVER